MLLTRILAARKTSIFQLMAMMLDFIPEAIVLGAVIGKDYTQAVLLAVIIFTQNLPESFNAYREIKSSSPLSRKSLVGLFIAAGLTGPFYLAFGLGVMEQNETSLGILMTFCSGGILYLVFNSIAPNVKLQNAYFPSLGALLGFAIGLAGKLLI